MKSLAGRPLMTYQEPQGAWTCTVSQCRLWTVLYRGETIQLRRNYGGTNQRKYLPVTNSQRGTAERLARELNEAFDTQDFRVAEIQVKPRDPDRQA
jgi:hypothetical protein